MNIYDTVYLLKLFVFCTCFFYHFRWTREANLICLLSSSPLSALAIFFHGHTAVQSFKLMHPTNQNVCRKNVNIKRTCVGIAVIPEGLPKKHGTIFGVKFNLFSQQFTTKIDTRFKECSVLTGWKWYHSKKQNPADCSLQELRNSSLRYQGQGRRGGQRLTISLD